MRLLARLTLLAYPRSFRTGFGADYLQTIADLQTFGAHSRLRIAGRLIGDALTTAPTMRWESLMSSAKHILVVLAAVAAAFGVLLGAPFVALPTIAIFAVLVLVARRHDRPIATEAAAWSERWYLWIAVAAGLFLVGLAVVAVDGDGELSTPAWATWILSWLGAAVLAAVGLGLGAFRLVGHRRI